MNRQEWWDSGFDPVPVRLPAEPSGPDRTLTALKWTGAIIGLMLLAPFVLAAQFLRTFWRL